MADNGKKNNDRSPNVNKKLEEIKAFLEQCRRVLMITRKPTTEEYINVAKITGLGITLLGVLGYIIHVPIQYIKSIIKPVGKF